MIPALATCLFVIYLYHKLKEEEEAAANPAGADADAVSVDNDALARRLSSLETRLQQLARKQEKQS